MQKRRTPRFALIFVVNFCSFTSVADVLNDYDNGPLAGIFGFSDSSEGSLFYDRGRHSWDASIISSSHSIDEGSGDETLRIDGETTRIGLSYRFRPSPDFEFALEVPYLWHESGSFDSFIDNWHDFFGLPVGARDEMPQDELEFFLGDANAELVNLTNNANGLGDMRFTAGWLLRRDSNSSTALRFGIKIPTGDSANLLGSGGADFNVGVAGDVDGLWGSAKLNGFYRVNVNYLGKPDLLSERYNKVVGQISGGLGYFLNPAIEFRAQLRWRSAVYESQIASLGNPSATLTFGVDFRLSERYRLAVAIGEDVKPQSAPDVTAQFSLRYVGH